MPGADERRRGRDLTRLFPAFTKSAEYSQPLKMTVAVQERDTDPVLKPLSRVNGEGVESVVVLGVGIEVEGRRLLFCPAHRIL